MSKILEIKRRIAEIRSELEGRHKYGTVKLADASGNPIPTEQLQNEMFNLTYKLSKLLSEE